MFRGKNLIVFFFIAFNFFYGFSTNLIGQETEVDSIKAQLSEAKELVYDDFPAALKLLKSAYDSSIDLDNVLITAEVLNTSGWLYYIKGKYDESLSHYIDAQALFSENNDQVGFARTLMGEGLVLQAIDRHKEALDIFDQVLNIYKELQTPSLEGAVFINMAISYIELKEYKRAEEVLEQAYGIAEQYDLTGIMHHYYNKAGEVAFQRGHYKKAIEKHRYILNDTTQANNWEKSYAHAGLAQAYLKLGEIKRAEENALRAINYAKSSESLWDLERNTAILAQIYEAQNRSREAYNQLIINQKYRDSLYDIKTAQQVNVMQLEEKELENKRLNSEVALKETELRSTRLELVGLISFVLLLLLILFLLWKNYRQKGIYTEELRQKSKTITRNNEIILKRNIALDKLNANKDKLFTIISHDLRSPISSIQQILTMTEDEMISPQDAKALNSELKNQVNATLVMIDNLLQWSHSQLDGVLVNPVSVDLPLCVVEVLKTYQASANFKDIKIEHVEQDFVPRIQVDAGHLSVILHNLISNALKFTYSGKQISLNYQIEEDFVTLIIIDQGTGIAQEKLEQLKLSQEQILSKIGTAMETGTGLGLMMVKQFLELNEALFDVISNPGEGTEFRISFKKARQEDLA